MIISNFQTKLKAVQSVVQQLEKNYSNQDKYILFLKEYYENSKLLYFWNEHKIYSSKTMLFLLLNVDNENKINTFDFTEEQLETYKKIFRVYQRTNYNAEPDYIIYLLLQDYDGKDFREFYKETLNIHSTLELMALILKDNELLHISRKKALINA